MDRINKLEKLLENWEASIVDYIPKVLLAIFVMMVFYIIAKFIKKYSFRFYQKTIHKSSPIASITSYSIYAFLILSGIFIALEILDLEDVLTKLLAGAGIVSIVVGFAFKEIASNAFAGLILNTQKPFKYKDWVKIDNNFGTINKIGWITTSINTIEGEEVFIPNQIIYNQSFTNLSTYGKRRVIFKCGVSYGDDLAHVKSVALDEVSNIQSALKHETIDFYFTSIGDSVYNFQLRFWISYKENHDYLEAMSETIMRIKKRFEQENISIAYSVMTLDFGLKVA